MNYIKSLIALILVVTHSPFYLIGYITILASHAFKSGRMDAHKHSEKFTNWLGKK